MTYQVLAAYALARLKTPNTFTPALTHDGDYIWGIDAYGITRYNNLDSMQKLSIIGAMCAAEETLDAKGALYTKLYNAVQKAIDLYYPDRDMLTISKTGATEVLRLVAQGHVKV